MGICELIKRLITIPNQNLKVVVGTPEYKEVCDVIIDLTGQQIILKIKE
jgi:hypothetical protein